MNHFFYTDKWEKKHLMKNNESSILGIHSGNIYFQVVKKYRSIEILKKENKGFMWTPKRIKEIWSDKV